MNGGKNEGYINSLDLLCALKLRADTRLRELRRATEFMEDENDRVEEILNYPLPERETNVE